MRRGQTIIAMASIRTTTQVTSELWGGQSLPSAEQSLRREQEHRKELEAQRKVDGVQHEIAAGTTNREYIRQGTGRRGAALHKNRFRPPDYT